MVSSFPIAPAGWGPAPSATSTQGRCRRTAGCAPKVKDLIRGSRTCRRTDAVGLLCLVAAEEAS